MTHKFKLFYFLLALSIFSLIVPTSASALEDAGNTKPGRSIFPGKFLKDENGEEKRPLQVNEKLDEKRQEIKAQFETKKCEIRQNMADKKVKWLELEARLHQERYERIAIRLNNLIKKMDGQGLDTSTLKSDLETLKTKIATLRDKHDALKTELQNIAKGECDPTKVLPIQDLQAKLKELRDAVKDVRQYFLTTIKQDLQDLRIQLEEAKESTESSKTEDKD